jgi:hypothetical protein
VQTDPLAPKILCCHDRHKMFLRQHGRIRNGREHRYWSLVKTVRPADGPRQRTLCYLGELNGSAHARWQKTIQVFNQQGESTQLKLFPAEVEVPDDTQVARVLVKKVRVERTRKLGDCYLGLELWKRLQLDDFFARHMDGDHADVPWSRIAAVLAINRLCDPGSELAVEQHWYPFDSARRSSAYRERQDQRHSTVSLPGPPIAAKNETGTAFETALWGTVSGAVRRTVVRPD